MLVIRPRKTSHVRETALRRYVRDALMKSILAPELEARLVQAHYQHVPERRDTDFLFKGAFQRAEADGTVSTQIRNPYVVCQVRVDVVFCVANNPILRDPAIRIAANRI